MLVLSVELFFFQLGNHDKGRVASRVTEKFVNAYAMLQLTLPGTPFIYYGDEIGMVDGVIDFEHGQDKYMGEVRIFRS